MSVIKSRYGVLVRSKDPIINIDGINYDYVRVGKLYITTENLKNLFNGDITLNGTFSNPSAIWFNNNESTAIANKYNLAYSINAIDVIDSHLSDGWRVWTKSDIDYIGQNFGNNKKFGSWSTNDFSLSLVLNGNGEESKSTFFNIGAVAGLRTKDYLCNITNDGGYNSSQINRWAAIRLVKDVD